MKNALLLLSLVVPALCWGQQEIADLDTVQSNSPEHREMRVYHIEHSKAGDYAFTGFSLGFGTGALAWVWWRSTQSNSLWGDYSEDRRKARKQLALLAGGGGIGCALFGAIIGSGEKWTEERRVGVVPLDDGAMLMVAMNWK